MQILKKKNSPSLSPQKPGDLSPVNMWPLSHGFLLIDLGSLDILHVWNQTKQMGKCTNSSSDLDQKNELFC